MAVKLTRPSERVRARYRPSTPRHVKLLILGAACVAVGISRWYFLPVGLILLGLGALDMLHQRRRSA